MYRYIYRYITVTSFGVARPTVTLPLHVPLHYRYLLRSGAAYRYMYRYIYRYITVTSFGVARHGKTA